MIRTTKTYFAGLLMAMVWSFQAISGAFEDSAHSPAFQKTYRNTRLAPLAMNPKILAELEREQREGAELAVYQTLLAWQSLENGQLTPSEIEWANSWASSRAMSSAQLLSAAKKVLKIHKAPETIEQWLAYDQSQLLDVIHQIKPETRCDWLQQIRLQPEIGRYAGSELRAVLSIYCHDTDELTRLIDAQETAAMVGVMNAIPQRFNPQSARALLIRASRKGQMAIAALPLLAQHFGDESEVQDLLVSGLSSERYGTISAVTLGRYGKQETIAALYELLQSKKLAAPADRYARLAIKQSGFIFDPLAIFPLFNHPFIQAL